jgi:hypothetical protein
MDAIASTERQSTAGHTAMTAKICCGGRLDERMYPPIQGPAIEPIFAIEAAQPVPSPR